MPPSCLRNYNEHNDEVIWMAVSPNGSTFASGSRDGSVHIRAMLHAHTSCMSGDGEF